VERWLTAEVIGNGVAGAAAVERIRSAVHEIAGSGLTLSKLAVAASLLGDLVRG
jgi:glutamate dehydrogenase